MHSRAFAAPLFGSSTSTTLYLNAGQRFANGSYWTAALYRGFPLLATRLSVTGAGIPWREGMADVEAGEVLLQSIGDIRTAESLLIEGLSARWRRGEEEWLVYAGDSRYPTLLAGFPEIDPSIAGIEYQRRVGKARAGGAVIFLDDAQTPRGDVVNAVVRGDYEYAFSPAVGLFSRGYVTDRGATALRAGARYTDFRGEVSASLFAFDDDFALVHPLFRPGEIGGDLYGSYRVTEFSRLYGIVTYLSSDSVQQRDDFRGHAGYNYALGSDGPYFDVSYHRHELTNQALTERVQNIVADRVVLSVTRASLAESLNVRLDHVMRRDQPERTQILASYGRLIGISSTVDSSLVVQKERSTIGLTAETAGEWPIRWPYAMRAGTGVALVRRPAGNSGEGLVEVGFSRRFTGQLTGWYAQVQARKSFGIGLPRTTLASDTVTVSFGNRLGWRDLAQARALFDAMISPSDFGTVEGRVTHDGEGVSNVPILVDGRQETVTRSDGTFRLTRVPARVATISVDTSVLEQGYVVAGEATRTLLVAPRAVTRIDFEISRLVALAGSIVRCRDGAMIPMPGVRIALVGDDFVQTGETSSAGGFELDAIPPGTYEIVIDPLSVPDVAPAAIPRRTIELSRDVLGHVITLECDPAESPDRSPAAAIGGQVEGIVRVNGIPAAGARVLVDGHSRAVTSDRGTFRLSLPAGEYLLSVRTSSDSDPDVLEGDANQRIAVSGGAKKSIVFDLRRSVRLSGRVSICAAGRMTAAGRLRVYLFGPHHAEAVTDAHGVFTIEQVPIGRYVVLLDAEALSARGTAADRAARRVVDLRRDQAIEIEFPCPAQP